MVQDILAVWFVVLLTVIVTHVMMDANGYRQVPQCPEDAVLVPSGTYENGRWSDYDCGPAVDDYQP